MNLGDLVRVNGSGEGKACFKLGAMFKAPKARGFGDPRVPVRFSSATHIQPRKVSVTVQERAMHLILWVNLRGTLKVRAEFPIRISLYRHFFREHDRLQKQPDCCTGTFLGSFCLNSFSSCGVLGVDSPFFSTIVLSQRPAVLRSPWVSGGFLERFGSLERMEMEGTPSVLLLRLWQRGDQRQRAAAQQRFQQQHAVPRQASLKLGRAKFAAPEW